jgi:excisionase family DNA binding protein
MDLVRTAAREGAEQALLAARPTETALPAPLIDKREVARALGISVAKVDRLCRDHRIPFVRVGDVRRFDLAAVRAALEAGGDRAAQRRDVQPAAPSPSPIAGVRLLSRRPGQAGG